MKGDVARTRAGAHDRVASLYVAQRFTVEVETVDEHAVDTEVRNEHEAIGRIGNDAVCVRCCLTRSVRSRAGVLNRLSRRRE